MTNKRKTDEILVLALLALIVLIGIATFMYELLVFLALFK